MRRFLPTSLGGQLIAIVLGALILGQVATALIFAESRRAAIEAVGREQVLARAAALVRLVEETPPDLHPRILRAASSDRVVFAIGAEPSIARSGEEAGEAAEDAAEILGEIIGEEREVRVAMVGPARFAREWMEDHHRGRWRGMPGLAISVRLADGRWLNSETVLPNPARVAWPALASTVLIGLALVGAVAFSVRRVTRPLTGLATAADRFGRGETVPPLPPEGPEELRRTIAAFNAMQGRVGRFIADRTRMLAAISHDLRTPLTALRLRAEFVEDPEVRDKIVDTVDEMSRIAEAGLAFAREESAAEEARATDLPALVRAVADDFADLGADVSVAAPDRLDLVVRPVALRRAVRNLVENAIRYGGRARIGLVDGADSVTVTVEDDGPGIPDDKLEEVFEPFVRLEASRSADTGGVGLGLATARTIARAHGGDVTLRNRPGGGLVAMLELPRGR